MPTAKYNKLLSRRVLLIGGTSGIGYATAECAIEAGASITIASSKPERLSLALQSLSDSYPEAAAEEKIQGHLCDLSKAESIENNLRAVLEFATKGNSKRLDHIVYTAADVPNLPTLADYQASEVKMTTMVIRYDAPIVLGKLAPSFMNPGPQSSITYTSASTASKPTPGRGILSALGASTEGITMGLAVDLAPIRVNAVAPGTVDTPLLRALLGSDSSTKTRIFAALCEATLLKKVGKPEEVAEAFVYLMKDTNITGAILHTDGGRLLK